MGLRVAMLVGAMTALGCSSEANPCLKWLQVGETYTVTVGAADPLPMGPTNIPPTCGTGFDLSPGDKLTFHAGNASYQPICAPLPATVDAVPNVKTYPDDRDDFGGSVIWPDLEARFMNVEVQNDDCHGKYRIGISGSAYPPEHLYRIFEAYEPKGCVGEGSSLSDSNKICSDSWLVRIEGSHGVVADSTGGR
ncbi:MAG TPA: hypothetical protein VHB79_10735 [Polyangiaceae bacterium]|nr:hypothetical protein [Polyangiaceae bacterium]